MTRPGYGHEWSFRRRILRITAGAGDQSLHVRQLFERQVAIRTYTQTSSGLQVNAPVRLNGILIGHVDKLLLSASPDLNRGVEIEMRIYKKFLDHIPDDSTATVLETTRDGAYPR